MGAGKRWRLRVRTGGGGCVERSREERKRAGWSAHGSGGSMAEGAMHLNTCCCCCCCCCCCYFCAVVRVVVVVVVVAVAGGQASLGGVVDWAAFGGGTLGEGAEALDMPVPIRRLITREDRWMAPPLPGALALFGGARGGGGACAEERETYRLAVGTAARPSYGKDMLLVSDKYKFVCVVIWKVVSGREGALSALAPLCARLWSKAKPIKTAVVLSRRSIAEQSPPPPTGYKGEFCGIYGGTPL